MYLSIDTWLISIWNEVTTTIAIWISIITDLFSCLFFIELIIPWLFVFLQKEYSYDNDNPNIPEHRRRVVPGCVPTFLLDNGLRHYVVKNQSQLANDASRETVPPAQRFPCTIYCPVMRLITLLVFTLSIVTFYVTCSNFPHQSAIFDVK